MTENEAKKVLIDLSKDDKRIYAEEYEALNKTIFALEEIQEYRAIGTVEDVAFYKKCYDEESYEYCGEHGTDTCGYKDRMKYLEKKIAEFESIGTIEEFKTLKENERKCEDCAGCTKWKCDCANIRDKIIDEFENKLKESLMYNYKHFLRTDTDGFNWLTTDAVETHIDEIVKKMKGAVDGR